MFLHYKIPPNSHKRRQTFSNTILKDDSHREHDIRRSQITSKDLEKPQKSGFILHVSNRESTINHTTNKENKLKGGSVHEIDATKDEFLNESLLNKNF